MGLLASIVAYLSVVAAIVIGFLMSADALLNHSHHQAANPGPQLTTAAKLDSFKSKNAAKPSRITAEQQAIPRKSMATEYRRKTELSNARGHESHRHIVQEAQRRYWSLHRERTAGSRALGYAEEPRLGGDPWR